MKRTVLFLVCLLLAGAGALVAQNVQVSGIVTDAVDGQWLPGVSVVVKGAHTSTSTDANGRYTISVPGNATLVFSFVGMKTQEQAVAGRAEINVTLTGETKQLEDVVVVAYGVARSKNAMSGAISTMKGEAIAAVPTPSFDQALAGKMAGVAVTTASGLLADGTSIRIRGTGSISLSSQPLVVIDGMPMTETSNLNVFNSGNGTRFNPMATINQNDIASIEVLKDAAAAALYGSRAANGVILITTKRGKAGSTQVSYSNYFGWSQSVGLPDLLGSDDFMRIQNEAAMNYWGPGAIIASPIDTNGDGVDDSTNWLDLAFRTGFSQNHQVSVNGGTEKLSFYGSADWLDQEGTVRGNSLERYAFRASVDATPSKYFKAGISVNYANTDNFGVLSDGYLAGVTLAAYLALPNVPEKVNGDYYMEAGRLAPGGNKFSYESSNTYGNAIYHPTATVDLQRNRNLAERVGAIAYAELTPVKGLNITSKLGIDNLNNFEDQYSHPSISGLGMSYNGLVQDNTAWVKQWNWQNYANYKVSFHNHNLSFMAGLEYQNRDYQDIYAGAYDFVSPDFRNILDGLFVETSTGGTKNSRGFMSYFGNMSYNFREKYYLDLSFRADGFSGFGKNNRFGYFPGLSAAWRITEEPFMEPLKDWLPALKIRTSWGVVGNSNVSPYGSRTLFSGGQYADINGVSMAQVGNAGLKWENTMKTDIGFDASLLNNHVNLSFDYWRTDISDMLLDAEVIRSTGIPGAKVLTNIGSMSNTGIEIQLNTVNYESHDHGFIWTSAVNLTTVNNKVKALAGDDILGANSLIVGQPMGVWRVYEWGGVDPATGRPGYIDQPTGRVKYYDANPAVLAEQKWKFADGTLAPALGNDDYKVKDGITGAPTWYGNFDNTVKWQNLDFTLGLQFAGGNKILNATRASLMDTRMGNKTSEILNRWTAPGQSTEIPKLYWGQNTGITTTSDRYLEDGAFLRFRDITIGYTLPAIIKEKTGVTGRIFARVNNLWVLTAYKGSDPEISTNRNANYSVGTDNRSVPAVRAFTVGINLNFQ
ncbi:MAG: TonB-dependent receptor [Prevotellaceae bacterium]|jgi:TonB-linked SusC/RagA family outer membrane protein|nr:TonB-dependent receptor [Prevotellaceae bacterium]